MRFLLTWIFLIAAGFGLAAPLSAETLNLSTVKSTDISKTFQYYSLPEGQLPDNRKDIAGWTKQLVPLAAPNPGGDRYIAVINLVNDTDQEHWFVYPYGSVIEHVEINSYTDSTRTAVKSGYNHPNSINFHYGNEIFLAKGQSTTLIILFESQFFFAPIKIVVHEYGQAKASLEAENILILLCIGIVLSLAVYNLFIYLGSGQKMYMYYALSLFCVLWGWSHVFGVIELLAQKPFPQFLMPPYLLSVFFSVWFTLTFLSLYRSHPKTTTFLKIWAILSLLCAPLAYLSAPLGLLLASLSTGVLLLTSLYAGISRWRQGYKPARYFVFAYITVLTPNIIGNMMNLGILPGLNVNIYLMGFIGNALDALLLAFALAEKVRLTNEQNADLTVNLEKKVLQRTEELAKATERAEQATNAKSDFLAKMSHEIRTPMNAVIGLSRLTLKTNLNVRQRDYVEKVLDAGEVLLGLINDILDFSKIEAGKLTIEKTQFKLDNLIRRAVNLSAINAHAKGVELVTDVDPDIPLTLLGDPLRLQQIVVNLVNNAVKFTEKGAVCIRVQVKEERFPNITLQFSVIDTGIGMSREQQSRLFLSFSQADESVTRKYGGTGLGLAISKQLCELMNGEIWLESELGKGSTFHFTVQLEETEKLIAQTLIHKSAIANLRVLVVDDIELAREVLVHMLANLSIKAHEAQNGYEAIEMIRNARMRGQPYDLVLMDWRMPGLDGISTSQRIVEEHLDDSPQILMVSAYDKDEARKSIENTEIRQFIEKPVSPSTLLEAISKMLSGNVVNESVAGEDIVNYVPDFSHSQILLVEDNAINRQVALGFLDDTKVHIDSAENGIEALSMIKQNQYDLVLMDIQMPQMDGLTATKEIRHSLGLQDLPIIAMTAHAMPADVKKSKDAGMNDHVTKPIDPDNLFHTMEKYLGTNTDPDSQKAKTYHRPESSFNEQVFNQLCNQTDLEAQGALQLMGGKLDLYVRLVKDFYRQQQNLHQQLTKLFSSSQWPQLLLKVHTLKSNAAYVGAPQLSQRCARFEAALEQQQHNQTDIVEVCTLLDPLIDQLSDVFDQIEAPEEQKIAFSNDAFEQFIRRLLPLLAASDFQVEDHLPGLQLMCQGTQYAADIEQMASLVDEVEFESAHQLAHKILNNIEAKT